MKITKNSDRYILCNGCGKDVCKNPPLSYNRERDETYCNDAGIVLFKGSPSYIKKSIKKIKKKKLTINTISMTKFQYMLAPMEDFSDNAFRTLCHRHGADLTFTELLRIEALAKNVQNTWERIEKKDNTPVIIQLLGSSEEDLAKFLEKFKPFPGFMGFNLNLGCPDPQVVSLGYGCAMIKNFSKVKRMIGIIKGRGYSCSVKMRLGKDAKEKEKKFYLNTIKEVDADFFIVHARHGKEGYDVKPDYSVFKEICKTGKIIIANGDIDSREKVERLKAHGVKGVMIGRAAVNNPQIFNFLKGNKLVSKEEIKQEYNQLAEKYNAPFRYRKNVLKRML